jgi:hypothetical protein
MRLLISCKWAVCLLALVWSAPAARAQDDDKELEALMKGWEKDVRKQIEKDDDLKKLTEKYPPVLLHSRDIYCNGDYKKSAYSFPKKSNDPKKHW